MSNLWADRADWFFGIRMGIYYDPQKSAIVPKSFLSLGVERFADRGLRLNYPLWQEKVIPILVLEITSPSESDNDQARKSLYEKMGVLYYVVYSSRSESALEIHKLVNAKYTLLPTQSPYWLSEIGLGIGKERAAYQGIEREWLFWYDEQENRYLLPDERTAEVQREANKARCEVIEARRKAEELRQQIERLRQQLRDRGIDPDSL